MYNVHLPIMLESERQAVYRERKEKKKGENWEHSAILSTFIKLPFVIKIFVLSIFEWLFYTGFTTITVNHLIFTASKSGIMVYFNFGGSSS